MTVIYKPQELLADLVWSRDDGLRFAIKAPGNAVTYESKVEGKSPLDWFGPITDSRTVRLPSQASPYKATGELLGGICKAIREYFDCPREFLLVVSGTSQQLGRQTWHNFSNGTNCSTTKLGSHEYTNCN